MNLISKQIGVAYGTVYNYVQKIRQAQTESVVA